MYDVNNGITFEYDYGVEVALRLISELNLNSEICERYRVLTSMNIFNVYI